MVVERRRHTRVPLHLSVTVIVNNEDIPVQARDLSLRGMACTPDSRFTEGASCTVQCMLGTGAEIVIDATIVRCSESGAALFFDGMDEEAFYHLKRLVQYNAEDPDTIDRELSGPAE